MPNFRDSCLQSQKYLERYQALAKELSICIVPGTIVEVDEGQNDIFRGPEAPQSNDDVPLKREVQIHRYFQNVAYFVDNNGDILARYVKKNLWGPTERDHLRDDDDDPHVAFDSPIGRVGLLVCWDLAFPEAWRDLTAQGAKTIILPTFCKLVLYVYKIHR